MELPGRVLDGWATYFSLEPWSGQRDELLNALLCQSIHKSMTGQTLDLETWLPKFDAARSQHSEKEASLRAFESWGIAANRDD